MAETRAELRRTPLEAAHRAAGAKMGAFAGWLMPIEYAGTLAEHAAVRENAGLFDVTHLGKIAVEGRGALETLQRSLTSDVSAAQPGQAQYGMGAGLGLMILGFALLFSAAGLFAQAPSASIVGRVTDPTGAVVPGVAVKATNLDTNISQTASSRQSSRRTRDR